MAHNKATTWPYASLQMCFQEDHTIVYHQMQLSIEMQSLKRNMLVFLITFSNIMFTFKSFHPHIGCKYTFTSEFSFTPK